MTDLQLALLAEAAAHPALQAQDICKLVYQHSFGCGHLVSDFSRCKEAVSTELSAVTEREVPLFMPIGNGYCRVDFSSAKYNHIPAELIAKLFFFSAQRESGTEALFLHAMEEAKELCRACKLPFSAAELDAFTLSWQQEGCPLFSHSAAYKAAYNPAYRVVLQQYAESLPLISAVLQKSSKEPVIIGIDGRCGGGKSTLGSLLQALFDATLIHMDDFFLPPVLRTAERLSEPGGNIHYERFLAEVVAGLASREDFSYGLFDCAAMAVTESVQVQKGAQVTIIEGSYALHPLFSGLYDITAFCTVDKALQKERIIERNGQAAFAMFEERWIPMEERYFAAFSVKENCRFVISMG